MEETFCIGTLTGYRIFRLSDIGYFTYEKTQRVWQAIFANSKPLHLRRQTGATEILQASDSFVQINQSIIINIHYLERMEGSDVFLGSPFDSCSEAPEMHISRHYCKELKDKLALL
jgi:two-component system LytT family response regulator